MSKQSPLFEILNSINHNKRDLISECVYQEKDYNPYVINRFLSGQMDSVIYANEMNIRPFLPKKLQYDFLRNAIRSRKRYSKWLKPELDENLSVICEYYNCSMRDARRYSELLNEEQIRIIHEKTSKGGKV
jgi:hypothetical protein